MTHDDKVNFNWKFKTTTDYRRTRMNKDGEDQHGLH